jgi:glycosyltransferase involved in cell wall biosynthesis
LRLLFLYDCVYPESLGGVEHRNHELAAVLARHGHEVTLAGFFSADLVPPPGVSLLPLGSHQVLYTETGRRSTKQALRFAAAIAPLDLGRFDVVETANIPYIHLPLLALRCRLASRPLVVTWYEYWGSYWRTYLRNPLWPFYAWIERTVSRFGTLRLASSGLTAGRLKKHGREVAGVVACGLDVARVRSLAAEASPGAPLIYAGRLQREKRLDLLLEAVARLAHRSERPLLSILGDGPDRDRLEQRIAETGLGRQVEMVGRLPTNREVWQRLGGARIAVQPSEREGFGLFPLEAMAAGLPVVYCSSSDSALPELVRAGEEGVAVPPRPELLAQVLEELLSFPERRARLAANASVRAEGYDWSRIAERFEAICRSLMPDS